ncbi:uncharacterized protein LOC134846814 [Symsagittifera roscoffensis]|uniref:uncharacterized protein LOC134846814 n=1 Tax=Symsagittifera roscoffensis TaxID=84072 RepID=UPI00307B9621
MILLFMFLVTLDVRPTFGSSTSSLGFSVTYTSVKILESFVNGTEKAKSSRLCGLSCLSRSFCRSFNYQLRSHDCEFLVTDSRLLDQENLLGVATWSRGLDWMHGEGSSYIRGCSVWEPLADECLWIRKIPPEAENSLTVQWQLPTLFNHEYPVLQQLRVASMESVCLQTNLPDELYEQYLPNDVRSHMVVGLTSGRLYEVRISTWFNGELSQMNTSVLVSTTPAMPGEKMERIPDLHDVEFFWQLSGCAQKFRLWSEPAGSSCSSENKCEVVPTEEDSFWFDGLTAGEDYFFYLQTESNGLSSDTYEVNQPTYPANTGDAFEVSTARQKDQIVFSVAFEPGTGSKVVFSYVGETSGGTYSEEREYMSTFDDMVFTNLMPGDKYTINVQPYSKGQVPLMRNFSTVAYTKPLAPPMVSEAVINRPDFSVDVECSFYDGYTQEVIVQELDGKFPEVIIPITMQQQMLHIPDVTPGDVHHIKLKPYSPYSIPGNSRWLNLSMYTANFTAEFTADITQIDVSTVTSSGTGLHFNISVVGDEFEVTDFPERTFDFSQLSRTTSFKDLMPGENYTITISSTSKSDRYTEALTHSSKFEEVIPPIAPQHVPQNWNDQCEEVQTNPGFAHIPNVTWHVKYYCDEFYVFFYLVQVGKWMQIKIITKNPGDGTERLVNTYDLTGISNIPDVELISEQSYNPPDWFEPGHMYDYYVQAISYGVETPLNGFYIKLTPFHDIYSPEAPYYPASTRTLVWLTRLWEFPENIQPTIITHTWPADDIFPTDSAIYWSPAKENSHQVFKLEASYPHIQPVLELDTFYWFVLIMEHQDTYTNEFTTGYVILNPVILPKVCDSDDFPDMVVAGAPEELLWSYKSSHTNKLPFANSIDLEWALPTFITKCDLTFVQYETGVSMKTVTILSSARDLVETSDIWDPGYIYSHGSRIKY